MSIHTQKRVRKSVKNGLRKKLPILLMADEILFIAFVYGDDASSLYAGCSLVIFFIMFRKCQQNLVFLELLLIPTMYMVLDVYLYTILYLG